MRLTLNVVLWVCLIWSYGWMLNVKNRKNVDWNDEDRNDEHLDQMLPDLVRLCPKRQYCGKGEIDTGNETYPENACCRGCSCDRNCSKSRDCCWGDDDVTPKPPCLKPSTNQDRMLYKYSFVSGPPTDGCNYTKGRSKEGQETCSSEEASLDNFYPVYSRSLDKNYKNAACARCHGAEDIKDWPGVLYSDAPSDFVGSLADFDEKSILNNIYTVFSPPNEESSSFDKLCFTEIDTCSRMPLDRFYIPSNVIMDRESIINACELGPKSIYLERPGQAFKNVFCAICNHYTNPVMDGLRCETSPVDRKFTPPIKVLLDGVFMASKKSQVDNDRKDRKIDCYRPKNSKNESICKELYCPSLQTRLQSGKCRYAAKIVSFEHLALCLNVSTEDDLDQDHDDVMNMTGSKIVSILEENSPWSKTNWIIISVGVRIVERKGLEFLVCFTWKTQKLNLERLDKQTKTSLTRKWQMRIGRKIDFDQQISKHGKISRGIAGSATLNADWGVIDVPLKMANLTPPTWKRLYLTDIYVLYKALYVDQMFLCEQIELSPYEYELKSRGGVLYLTKTQSFLYPGQYTHLVTQDGALRVRVCLKDSGDYVKVARGTGIRPGKVGNFVLSISFCLCLLIDMV